MSFSTVDIQSCNSSLLGQECRQSCYSVRDVSKLNEINRKFAEAAVTDNETVAEAKAKEIVQFLMRCMQQ